MGQEAGNDKKYAFGPFCFDAKRDVLTKEEKEVDLTPRPKSVLLVLLENAGELVRKQELEKKVWRIRIGGNSLSQQISVLRKALEETPGKNEYIETVPREGYRFVADVKTVSSADKGYPADSTAEKEQPGDSAAREDHLGDSTAEPLVESTANEEHPRTSPAFANLTATQAVKLRLATVHFDRRRASTWRNAIISAIYAAGKTLTNHPLLGATILLSIAAPSLTGSQSSIARLFGRKLT